MIIVTHICFFYIKERISYLNRIIHETNKYKYTTDIFIHTNEIFSDKYLDKYTNGKIWIVYHDLTNEHPFYLSWKCRDLLKKQKDDYDIFMYIEDDILVPHNTLEYWLKYNEKMIEMNYNIGFVRIEIDKNNIEFMTDIHNVQFNKSIELNGEKYCINDINPYCAFWIYNKKEFHKFVNSKYYNINNILRIGFYPIRESSAIGLHGFGTNWYKNTIIPMKDGKLINDCKIYHMPNNYINNNNLLTKFDECISSNIK